MTVLNDRMTERAQLVLDFSLREAIALGHNYIGTEHILLALVREEEGLAGFILEDLGLSREQVRDAVTKKLRGGFPPPKNASKEPVTPMNVSLPGWIERPLEAPELSDESRARFYKELLADAIDRAANRNLLSVNKARALLNLRPFTPSEAGRMWLPHPPKRWQLLRRWLRRHLRIG